LAGSSSSVWGGRFSCQRFPVAGDQGARVTGLERDPRRAAECAPNLQRCFGMPIDPVPYARPASFEPACRARQPVLWTSAAWSSSFGVTGRRRRRSSSGGGQRLVIRIGDGISAGGRRAGFRWAELLSVLWHRLGAGGAALAVLRGR